VDDTGAGYAGLRHVLELRPALVKLDASLVSGIDRDRDKRYVLEMAGIVAERIDAQLLAEGVERPAELETLRALGVPLGQGHFLGSPAPPWTGLRAEASTVFHHGGEIDRELVGVSRIPPLMAAVAARQPRPFGEPEAPVAAW
jgi:EAL domain-containing protein (putative c-di-GMP-specific phosphodiesterase class I)